MIHCGHKQEWNNNVTLSLIPTKTSRGPDINTLYKPVYTVFFITDPTPVIIGRVNTISLSLIKLKIAVN